MYLSKSKYCKGFQCEKMLWLEKNMPEKSEDINNDNVFDNGTEVGILAQDLFGPHKVVEFNEDLSQMIEDTNNYLKSDKIVLCEASLSYNNNFCSVDILIKNNDEYEIYEVKSSTHVSDIYLEDVSYQYYVLTKLNLNVTKCSIVYINNKYIRNGALDIHKLFNIKDVTDIAKSKLLSVENKIKSIENYMNNTIEKDKDISENCFSPYPCPFYKYCSRKLKSPNVFDIASMPLKSKLKYYSQGKYTYESLINENINEKYKQQIEYNLYKKDDYINKKNIKKFLDTLSYPLYFLDFETYQQSIPKFDGVNPYMQIPFQYSLHYIKKENDIINHKEFLAKSSNEDPRRALAERLVLDIPRDVCVLAYNMSFEKNVIEKLAMIYPDLRDHLLNIKDNIKDLIIPFKNRDYYTMKMDGSYSIKYVLPALFPNDPTLDYHNLDMVHKGDEASSFFSSIDSLNEEDKKRVRESLLKYCELDTYAMVKIWQKLNEVIK
ncbi:MAG: DUF2779 domain-containing protein [Bacilli bacterium]|nr:DUF2779 domain-containing protein [Bacilli bacterium]